MNRKWICSAVWLFLRSFCFLYFEIGIWKILVTLAGSDIIGQNISLSLCLGFLIQRVFKKHNFAIIFMTSHLISNTIMHPQPNDLAT